MYDHLKDCIASRLSSYTSDSVSDCSCWWAPARRTARRVLCRAVTLMLLSVHVCSVSRPPAVRLSHDRATDGTHRYHMSVLRC